MVEYNKYTEYKDSGVEWLGEIPAGWTRTKVGSIYKVISGAPFKANLFTDENAEKPIIKIGDVLSQKPSAFTNESCVPELAIQKNDLLIGMSGYFNVSLWDKNELAYANQRVGILRSAKEIETRYFYYLLPEPLSIANSKQKSTIIKNLSMEDLRNLLVPIPPPETQHQIVAFLDAETKKIDDSVSSMESLISLLTEKRAALISETVTRGIPGEHTEFKDSGVEWLGDIPVGWETRQAKAMMHVTAGQSPEGDTVNSEGKGVPFIQGSAEFGKKYVETDKFTTSPKKFAQEGDLIISVRAPVGDLNYAPYKLSIGRGVASIQPLEGITKLEYLAYAFEAHKPNFATITKGSTFQAITMSNLGSVRLPLPSIESQEKIFIFLDTETKKIDTIINEAKKSIALLKEKRQTLISDAVTGKIDVTNGVN